MEEEDEVIYSFVSFGADTLRYDVSKEAAGIASYLGVSSLLSLIMSDEVKVPELSLVETC